MCCWPEFLRNIAEQHVFIFAPASAKKYNFLIYKQFIEFRVIFDRGLQSKMLWCTMRPVVHCSKIDAAMIS